MERPTPDANQLAVDRTRLAHERTLMAWIRTAVSLISFGFTIFKFFQVLREANPGRAPEPTIGSHLIAILMILIGLVALTLGWFQHRQEMSALRKFDEAMPYSLAGLIAAFVAALGVLALVAVTFRW